MFQITNQPEKLCTPSWKTWFQEIKNFPFKISYASFVIDGTLNSMWLLPCFIFFCIHILALIFALFAVQWLYRTLYCSTLWIDYLRIHTRVHFKCYQNYFEYLLRTSIVKHINCKTSNYILQKKIWFFLILKCPISP